MTAEEFFIKMFGQKPSFREPPVYEKQELIRFAELYAPHYHRTKVESVTDEEIKAYAEGFYHIEYGMGSEDGAQWMKQKLLK